ncbi:hypothetical protein [Asanoa sp. NPDC050611]|uniref:hypothetical protein n=1 Tax=Asanoa sp. NPDC050611 TaxID=3157098 RepID=UPI0033D70F6A
MTSPLEAVARRLDELATDLIGGSAAGAASGGATLAGTDRRPASAGLRTGVDLAPAAFGGDLPGRLGTLGRELYARWSGELAEHDRAAGALAARLTDTAATLRSAGGGYAGVEDEAVRRGNEAGGS